MRATHPGINGGLFRNIFVHVYGAIGLRKRIHNHDFASATLRVTERYTPLGSDALMYEATIEDPAVFTRPWKISMPLYRRLEANAQILEFKCVEFAEELLYGHLRQTNAAGE